MKTLTKPGYAILRLILGTIEMVIKPINGFFDRREEARQWMGVFRLGLIQFGIGLCLAPISGTLNRVMISELKIPAVAVGFLIALHYFVSPVRALIGYRSDKARSQGRWRTPYVALGVMLAFGGLTCAPFALILLGGNGTISFWPAMIICTGIFIAYGAGINILETVYLALVSDITPPQSRGKVIAMLWVMLILGTIVSAITVSSLLVDYSHQRLIQVMQTAALIFVILTVIALYRQERLRPDGTIISGVEQVRVRLSLWESIRLVSKQKALVLFFGIVFIATMAFASHDVLLEPYGGEVLQMSVSATTQLTTLWGVMTIVGVGGAAYFLWRRRSPALIIILGCIVGVLGFGMVSYASEAMSVVPFCIGVSLISIGRGLFLVSSVVLVMSLTDISHAGLFLGLWGIVQAMAQGVGVISSGLMRDIVQTATGSTVVGYTSVYITALVLLLAVVLIIALRFARYLQVSQIRVPWAGMEEIPADQLAF